MESVIRAYGKWEEGNFPKDLVRCGGDAHKILIVMNMGMRTPLLSFLHDCAVCVFGYCMNGLRDRRR